jgi:ribulose-bisphosphate carboxylase large chain
MGDRIDVTYRLTADDRLAAKARAAAIAVEQTVEFPEDLITDPGIREGIIGRPEFLTPAGPGAWEVVISYAAETAGRCLLQLLNLVFGNVSLQPGVRVQRIALPAAVRDRFRGPRYGVDGFRFVHDAPSRPLLATALKPMGLSPAELAELAYRFACGGVDLIKDDHGLADQAFSAFEGRVRACAAAVTRANRETGGDSRYIANLVGPAETLRDRAFFAKRVGAGGLMVAPGLVGWDAMRALAEDENLGLPILLHPALLGGFTVSPASGIAHEVLFGTLARLAGADIVIFPNHGGRFSFSPGDCRRITHGCAAPLGELRTAFPAPAGGMTLERVPEMRAFYGDDVVLLIGGDLHRHGDLVETCRRFREMVEEPLSSGSSPA